MLAADELDALYQAECALTFEEIKREEDARFFNLPHTAADFATACGAGSVLAHHTPYSDHIDRELGIPR